jgi:hypothetical protein
VVQLSNYEVWRHNNEDILLRVRWSSLDYLHMKWSLTRLSWIFSPHDPLTHSLHSVQALGFATTALFPSVHTKFQGVNVNRRSIIKQLGFWFRRLKPNSFCNGHPVRCYLSHIWSLTLIIHHTLGQFLNENKENLETYLSFISHVYGTCFFIFLFKLQPVNTQYTMPYTKFLLKLVEIR